MSAAPASTRGVAADGYAAWIEIHRAKLAEGHDPLGHLFAIERLARAARAEVWAARRLSEPERHAS
jgi:hypothetical protein